MKNQCQYCTVEIQHPVQLCDDCHSERLEGRLQECEFCEQWFHEDCDDCGCEKEPLPELGYLGGDDWEDARQDALIHLRGYVS